MTDENLTIEQWHKKEAIENFNGTWDLIEKKNRTHEDNLNMIHKAHTSRYHWSHAGDVVHFVRGEWQISRVYSILVMAESALLHGKEAIRLCEDNDIIGFDLAFSYEAVARAYNIINDTENVLYYKSKAASAADDIEDIEDREYILSELESIG